MKIKLNLKSLADNYLSSMMVMGIDMVMSLLASLLALLLVSTMLHGQINSSLLTITWIALSLVLSAICFYFIRTFRVIIRHSTLRDIAKFAVAVLAKLVIQITLFYILFFKHISFTRILTIGITECIILFCLLVGVRVAMVYAYDFFMAKYGKEGNGKCLRILIYGTGDKSVAMVKRLEHSLHYKVIGFLTPETSQKKYTIADTSVYQFETEGNIKYLKNSLRLGGILFASELDAIEEQSNLIQFCSNNGMKVLLAPPVDEVIDGQVSRNGIREVKIEDLLGREEIKINMEAIRKEFSGKTVMVTGAAGSIGSELCRQLAKIGVKHLVLFDNAETPMHNIRLELEQTFPQLQFTPVIGDVRLKPRIDFAFRHYKPQVVFHAAAYKHVPLMEENPCEAVNVNVTGSHYIANKCIEYDVEKMVMISTDKAVNPTNIMGCTKRLAEIYVQSLGQSIANGTCPRLTKEQTAPKTKFVTTRFGNVLGSNGSVIPRFREQIESGGPVTVTHPEITRFFMTIPEACRLVMEAATLSNGNEIFVFDMGKSVKIDDLARKMITLAGLRPDIDIKIQYTGLRPGEKLYEEVLSNKENTIPTPHSRILIANVRKYDYAEAHAKVNELTRLAINVEIPEMVKLMKQTVPEFISNNSEFEKYDKISLPN